MSSDQHPENPMHPVVLSMEVDDEDLFQSEYRVRIGHQVKYIIISPKTFDRDTLSFPIESLPSLPWCDEWTVAHISRDETSGDLRTSIANKPLAGVKCQWHHAVFDCLALKRVKVLTGAAFEAVLHPILPITFQMPATVIAKIARFEWEIPRIERETRAYQLLENSGLTPRFLGHIHENGRIMGFLLEKIEGRPASIQDLDICEAALGKLHKLGFLHGDVNRYNFLVVEGGVTILDFERLQEKASWESMHKELGSLRLQLTEDSGLGGGFIFQGDSN